MSTPFRTTRRDARRGLLSAGVQFGARVTQRAMFDQVSEKKILQRVGVDLVSALQGDVLGGVPLAFDGSSLRPAAGYYDFPAARLNGVDLQREVRTAPTLPVPVNTAVPTVSGDTAIGATILATPGKYYHSPTSYTYQWQQLITGVWTDVSGQTSTSYTTTVDGDFRIKEIASNATGAGDPAYSNTFVVSADAPVLATFNTVNATANCTFSNGNRTMEIASGAAANCLTTAAILEKTYFELIAPMVAGETGWGSLYAGDNPTLTTSVVIGQWYGEEGCSVFGQTWSDNASYLYGLTGEFLGAIVSHGSAQSDPCTIQFCVDPVTRGVWLRTDNMAPGWRGGGDPAAGTSPTFVFPGSSPIYGGASCDDLGESVTLVLPENFVGSPPAGFRAGILA